MFFSTYIKVDKIYPKKPDLKTSFHFIKLIIYYSVIFLLRIYYYVINPLLTRTNDNFGKIIDTWDICERVTNKEVNKNETLRILLLSKYFYLI